MHDNILCGLFLFLCAVLSNLSYHFALCRKLPLQSKSKQFGVVFKPRTVSTELVFPPQVCETVVESAALDTKHV